MGRPLAILRRIGQRIHTGDVDTGMEETRPSVQGGDDSGNKRPDRLAGTMIGVGIAIGTGTGVALGAAFDKLALGIAIGSALGVAIGAAPEQGHGGIAAEPDSANGWRLWILVGLGLAVPLGPAAIVLLPALR